MEEKYNCGYGKYYDKYKVDEVYFNVKKAHGYTQEEIDVLLEIFDDYLCYEKC